MKEAIQSLESRINQLESAALRSQTAGLYKSIIAEALNLNTASEEAEQSGDVEGAKHIKKAFQDALAILAEAP